MAHIFMNVPGPAFNLEEKKKGRGQKTPILRKMDLWSPYLPPQT